MKKTKPNKHFAYILVLIILFVTVISATKFIYKFNSIITTFAVIATSVTFMIAPATNVSQDVANNTFYMFDDFDVQDNYFDSNLVEGSVVFDSINNINDINDYENQYEFVLDNTQFFSNNNIDQTIQPVVQLVRPDDAGAVIRKTYTAGTTNNFISLSNGFINNATTISSEEVIQTISLAPDFDILADGTPEVLIMHTHATETYLTDGQNDWYDLAYDGRTTDETKNVIRVGQEIALQLQEVGIGVIHDTTLHDYPSFNGAYDRSAITVQEILDANPNIKVVLDVHRDAIVNDSTTITAPVTTINGKDAAQIMIISGCDNGLFNMPNYMENLKFSSALQQQLELMYPSITRPILFDYRKYNQHLTTGSILLEMGGHANTLEEAIYSGELLGKALATLLIEL